MEKADQDYIDAPGDARRELYLQLQEMLLGLHPDISVKLAYGVVKYYNANGWIYLGYWKHGVSLYPGKTQGLQDFKARHPGIKTSIGTINLKLGADIPWDDVAMVFRTSLARATIG